MDELQYEDIGYVYVLKDAERGLCKIGMSKNPLMRLSTIKTAAGCEKTTSFISRKTKDARGLERKTHAAFSAMRVAGEWFKADFTNIVNFVKDNVDSVSDEYEEKKKKELDIRSENIKNGLIQIATSLSEYGKNEKIDDGQDIGVKIFNSSLKIWINSKDMPPPPILCPILANLPCYGGEDYPCVLYFDEKKNSFYELNDPDIEIKYEDIFEWRPIVFPDRRN